MKFSQHTAEVLGEFAIPRARSRRWSPRARSAAPNASD
jgi:hypothetical protein